jgi:membrane-bound lytic murein transglycosylase A
MLNLFIRLVISCLILGVFACVGKVKEKMEKVHLKEVYFSEIKTWKTAEIDGIRRSFLNSCDVAFKRDYTPKTEFISLGDRRKFLLTCVKVKALKNDEDFVNYLLENYRPFLIEGNGSSKGKFTAYYQVEMEVNDHKTSVYKFPIYAKPSENADKYTTEDVEVKGVLSGKEILWAKNYYDIYMLRVQGSGFGKMPSGEVVNISFDGASKHSFASCEQKYNEKLHSTRKLPFTEWMKKNGEEAMDFCAKNTSRFVYFKIQKNEPRTSSGALVTAKRTLAVDDRYMPYGAILWVETDGGGFSGPLIAQDKGSAIKGVVRGDIYMGSGDNALKKALKVNSAGKYYIFLPK